MGANVGFGEMTRNVGIEAMCQWVSVFKTSGKWAWMPSALLSHKHTKRRWRGRKVIKLLIEVCLGNALL